MSRRNETVEIVLNGELVFSRPLPDMSDVRPRLFRYFTQEARVRRVTLTGAWPETSDVAELNSKLMDLSQPLTAADRRLINSMQPDIIDELQVPEVLAKAKELPAADGYAMLKKWVLPNDEHDFFRLAFQAAPILPESDPSLRTAEDLLSPALELVYLAKQLNRIDELTKEVEGIAVASDADKRSQQAILAMLAMHDNDPQLARERIGAVAKTLMAGLPQSLTAQQRAAELLVTWEAMQHPEMLPFAVELATKLRDNERDEKLRSNDDRFRKLTHGLIGRLDLISRQTQSAGEPEASGTNKLTQWASVPYVKPEHRYRGHRASHWSFTRGGVNHHPAETWSQLFFQSPLRGKFEILGDRSTYGYKEVAVSYGMHAAEPRYDLKAVRTVRLMHASNDIEKAVTLPAWNAMAEFRIVVDGSKVTTFTNGVQIHEEILEASPSPWIVLQTHGATDEAMIRNLRIVGTPEIPEAIDLIDMAGWNCWRADTYGEWHSSATTNVSNTPWQKAGDELVGNLKKDAVGPTESLLLYQRPMLEDGTIEFETFYVPGEQEVHPAVGQSAILLQPDGAQLHTLTMAQFETRSLAVDNATPIANASKIDLKPNDWNKVKLTLKGDQLTVAVNGADVATHTVTERRNERFFGLFRYSNRTQCRVRNLIYRGDWPKTLPSIEEQELAASASQTAANTQTGVFSEAETKSYGLLVTAPLASSLDELKSGNWKLQGVTEKYEVTPNGLLAALDHATAGSTYSGFTWNQRITADCEVTLDFSEATFVPVKEGWGQSLELAFRLDDPQETNIQVEVSMDGKGNPRLQSMMRKKSIATEAMTYHQVINRPGMKTTGRLRLVRQRDQIYCLFAEAGSDQFEVFSQYNAGKVAIRDVSVYVKRSDVQGTTRALLNSLTIRTATASSN